uniref:Uncharacterized protein n=1 Tax=viral metagenome TaxID=1070528 RepID=A0A6C0BF72_9ZZZZ
MNNNKDTIEVDSKSSFHKKEDLVSNLMNESTISNDVIYLYKKCNHKITLKSFNNSYLLIIECQNKKIFSSIIAYGTGSFIVKDESIYENINYKISIEWTGNLLKTIIDNGHFSVYGISIKKLEV